MMEVCDVVTINCSSHPEIERLFKNALLAKMKRGSYNVSLSRSQLVEDHADVVVAYPEQASERERSLARELLDDSERRQAACYRFERDRELYIFSHAFLRITLGRYLDAEPRTLRFVTMPGGRPEIDVSGSSPIRFNLSHTDGLVACIVTGGSDCGVDAEIMRRADFNLLEAVLTKSELSELMALSEEHRPDRFYEIWTLKEAYVKGRGLGLSIPLQHLDFSGFDGVRRLTIAPGVKDASQAWRFWSATPTQRHRVAAALRSAGSGATFRLVETRGLF